jgi:hypothetical protein
MPCAERAPRVAVAGTVFEVRDLDAAGRAWVVERYAAFLLVTVAIDDTVPEDDAVAATIETRGAAVRLGLGGYRIEGDLEIGRLRLLAPPLPTVLSPAAFRFLCSLVVLRKGGVMLHAAAVVDAGRALVFCGPSESGKTTVARLAGRRPVLSDETVALRPDDVGYRACATPFFGEAGPVAAQTNAEAAPAAIFFLRKGASFGHRRLGRGEAVQRAFSQVFLPKRVPALVDAILGNLDRLTAAVPCFELEFAARDELWRYVGAVA